MRYLLEVIVTDENGERLRYDARSMENNAKPDEEWTWMVEQAAKAILHHATSQTPHHPFAHEYHIAISRATEAEDAQS